MTSPETKKDRECSLQLNDEHALYIACELLGLIGDDFHTRSFVNEALVSLSHGFTGQGSIHDSPHKAEGLIKPKNEVIKNVVCRGGYWADCSEEDQMDRLR